MKQHIHSILCALLLSMAPAGAQTWSLSATMTATLGEDSTLTVRTTSPEGEAMPDFNGATETPWIVITNEPGVISGNTTIKSVVIEEGITGIGNYAFPWCHNMTSVSLPSSLATIGDGAFFDCDKLTSVSPLPASLTSIKGGAFGCCNALTALEVDAANPAYLSDGGVLYSKDRTLLHTCPGGKSGTFVVPSSVRILGDGAFHGCEKLTAVEIHNAVTAIGSSVFRYCTMPVVNIPASVTSIGDYVFEYTRGLTAINVDAANPAYTSEDGVLYDKAMTRLIRYPESRSAASFDIPPTVTTLAYGAFSYATLGAITVPASVTAIGSAAFEYCTNLSSISIPAAVGNMGSSIFWSCTSLTDVTVQWTEPLAADNTFGGFDLAAATLHVPSGTAGRYKAAPVWKDFGTIEAPDLIWNLTATMTATLDGDGTLTVRTTRAGGEAMPDFESQAPWFNTDVAPLITSAVIEEGVTGLGFYAFFGCFNLTSAALPSSLTRIGLYAFYGCSKLETVFIPASVTTIETVSFSFCSALTAIEVDAANPAYLSDGGVLYSKDRTLLHTCPGGKGGTFTVPSTVRVLGDAAFYGCEKLTAVEIHNAVTTIGSSAFGYCEMPVVNIPASVTSIGHDAFRGRVTRGVTAINVDAANTAYTSEDGVLYNKDKTLLICYPAGKAATSFDIPATVTTIRGAAFCFATFTSVTIPSSVETVEGYAFEYCTNLRDVTVQWDEPLSVDNHTFHAVDLPAATLHVSYGTKALYEAAPVWKDFGSIEEEEEEEEEEEGDDTGSEAVAPASLRVYALAGSLHISSATSCTVHIYTPAGRLVKQLYLPAGETASAALPGGLYIVRAGGETRKAAVR